MEDYSDHPSDSAGDSPSDRYVLTPQIKALPLPEGCEWAESDWYFGVYNRKQNWWHWWWLKRWATERTGTVICDSYNKTPKGLISKRIAVIADPYEAACLMSAKMMFGLYE
jgi:hypothetical protein